MTLIQNIPPELARLQEKLYRLRQEGLFEIQNGDEGYATAPSNIALLKYWGKDPKRLQIPDNSSLSLTLDGFRTHTKVQSLSRFLPEIPLERKGLGGHQFFLSKEGSEISYLPAEYDARPSAKWERFINSILHPFANDIAIKIETTNQFPTACGIASSASGYAAFVGALADLLNLQARFSPQEMQYWISEWSRIGSGSATRSSLFGKDSLFVTWKKTSLEETQTEKIPYHPAWQEAISHCVFILDETEKSISSSAGHTHASSSVFHKIRVSGMHEKMQQMERALEQFDFETVARLSEDDAFAMHAVMQTGTPAACYLREETADVIASFVNMRNEFLWKAFWTLDAGPNIHFIFQKQERPHMEHFHSLMESSLGRKIRVLYNEPTLCGLTMGRPL